MDKRICIVAHKYLTQPDDELVNFLVRENCTDVLHIMHSFPDAPDRRSYYRRYRPAQDVRQKFGLDFMGWPGPIVYVKEAIYTLIWGLLLGKRWDTYIAMDGLCALWGILLRPFKVSKVVYWVIDVVPENRFDSRILNAIYRWVNIFACRHADEVWDLSGVMMDARRDFYGLTEHDYKAHRVVPYGMWVEDIKRYPLEECERHCLVFMGHMLKKQGVQNVLAALPAIAEAVPGFRFLAIGAGAYLEHLQDLAKDLGVDHLVEFKGYVEDIRHAEEMMARSALAIAPYLREKDSWTHWADPGKVKSYLACGLPVLLTDVPWNAREIEAAKCGRIIEEDPSAIATAVIEYLTDDTLLAEQRKNAANYAKSFDYDNIFRGLKL